MSPIMVLVVIGSIALPLFGTVVYFETRRAWRLNSKRWKSQARCWWRIQAGQLKQWSSLRYYAR